VRVTTPTSQSPGICCPLLAISVLFTRVSTAHTVRHVALLTVNAVAPAQPHAAVDARDGTAAEAPPPAQSQPGAVQASASQPFSAAPTSNVCDMTTTAVAGDVTAAAAAQAPAPQLASTSKTQARAPLRRASHFYVQRQLEDIDEAEANEEKEKVRGHAAACNASCGALQIHSRSSTLALDMLEETKFKKSGAQLAVVRACATQARHCDMLRTAPSHSLQEGADAKKKRVTRTAQSSCNCEGGTLVHA
jgi:hypothetical protein